MNPADRPRAGEHATTIRALVDLTRAPSGVTPPLGIPIVRPYGETTPLPDGRLASFVRATMEGYKELPGLLDVQVCLSPHSRPHHTETSWITLADWLDDEQRAAIVERALTSGEEGPLAVGDETASVLARPIRRRGTGTFGYLLALFEHELAAVESDASVDSLVEDLALGLALRRQALATDAATELSSALAEAGSHQEALRWMTDILCMATRSDGAKVHVLRRTPAGPRVELLYRTDRPDSPRLRHGLSRKAGFVDWAFVQNDWLLFPARATTQFAVPRARADAARPDSSPPNVGSAPPERKAGEPGSIPPRAPGEGAKEGAHDVRDPPRALTGRHGIVAVVPREGADDADMPAAKDGRPMLIVPLRVRGRVLGALSLWRNTSDLYDSEMDRPLVEMLGRHVASACRWLMHWEVMQRAVAEVSELGRVAAAGDTSHAVYRAVCAGVGRLAQAARAVLLLQDGARNGTYLYYGVALWSGVDDEGPLDALAARYVAEVPAGTDHLVHALCESLRQTHVGGREGVRFVLRLALPMGSVVDARGAPAGVVALFDQDFPDRERRPTADDGLGRDAAATFLEQVAPIAWGSYPQAFAQKVARELSDPNMLVPESPETVLARAAELLVNRTGADAVLVYRGDHGKMVVVSAAPERADLLGMAAGSHTADVLHSGRMHAVRDTEDVQDPLNKRMDRRSLGKIALAYGWHGVRSWLCYPLVEGGRTLGLLKLLTKRGGTFLDPCATAVVEAVAARATAEIRRMTRALMLAGLNQLAHDLGGKERHELTRTMAQGAERWARRFIHPSCHVVIVASVRSPQPRLFAFCPHVPPDRFDADNAERLLALFDAGRKRQRVEALEVAPPWVIEGKAAGKHQMITPIDAPGNLSLLAWLIIAGDEPFSPDDLAVAREAARELSIFLDYEHRRQVWAHQVARFRHAVIGPMQGLTSAARMLARVASDQVGDRDKERVRQLALRVEEEAESTRLWRENQRIYMAEEVEIVPKHQPLRPIVEKCIKRFIEMLQARGIGLALVWRPQGSVDFPFDAAALDLIVTNLLDNARKYAFFNREIEVGVEVDGPVVRVWVENVGHAIPDRLARSIYRVGERLDWKDPIRAIDGTGLGLPMARALVEAHGGNIRHTSQPLGAAKERPGELQPHRVRFVVELPHQWRQR
jgi:signal transduction histidine kinase/GAF domain-containing protein